MQQRNRQHVGGASGTGRLPLPLCHVSGGRPHFPGGNCLGPTPQLKPPYSVGRKYGYAIEERSDEERAPEVVAAEAMSWSGTQKKLKHPRDALAPRC